MYLTEFTDDLRCRRCDACIKVRKDTTGHQILILKLLTFLFVAVVFSLLLKLLTFFVL